MYISHYHTMLNWFKTLSSLGLMKIINGRCNEVLPECLSRYGAAAFAYYAVLNKNYFRKSHYIHSTLVYTNRNFNLQSLGSIL